MQKFWRQVERGLRTFKNMKLKFSKVHSRFKNDVIYVKNISIYKFDFFFANFIISDILSQPEILFCYKENIFFPVLVESGDITR